VSVAVEGNGINRLLNDLPRKDLHRTLEQCESIALEVGATLCETDQPLRHVYFPLSGFISLVTKVNGHKPLELGLIGNEGMLGVTVVLGVDRAPQRAVVQGAGTALRMSKPQFARELRASPHFSAPAQSISLWMVGPAFAKHRVQSLPRGRSTISALAINDPRPGPGRSFLPDARISSRYAGRAPQRRHYCRRGPSPTAPNPLCARRNPHSRPRGTRIHLMRMLRRRDVSLRGSIHLTRDATQRHSP